MLNTVHYLNFSHRSKTMDINQKSLTSPSSVQVTEQTLEAVQEHQEHQGQILDLAIPNQASEKDGKSGLSGAGATEGIIKDSLDQDTGIVESGSQKNSSSQAKKSERTISVAEILKRTKAEKDAKAAEKDAIATTISSNDVANTHSSLSVKSSSAELTSAALSNGESTIATGTSLNNNLSPAEFSSAELLVAESSSVSVSELSQIHVSDQSSIQKKAKAATHKTKKSQHIAKRKQSETVGTVLTTDSNLSLTEQIDVAASDLLSLDPENIENLVSESESTESSDDQCSVIQLESEQDTATKQPPVPAANYRQSIHELQQSAASEGIMLNINEDLLNLPDEEICKLGVVEIKGHKNSIKEFCKFTFKDAALGKKVIDIQLNTDDPEQLSKLLPQSNDVSLDKFIESFALYTGRLVDPNYAKYRQQIAIIPESSQEYEAYFTRLHNIFLFGQTATIEDVFPHAFKRPSVDKILERYLPYGSVPLKSLYRMHVRYSALSRLDAGAESIMNCNIQYPELMQVSATPLVASKNQDALDTSANSMREQGLSPAITSLYIEQPKFQPQRQEVQYQRQFANLAYDSVFSNKAEQENNGAFSNQAANQDVNLGGRTDIEQAAYLNQGFHPYQNSNPNQGFHPYQTSNPDQGCHPHQTSNLNQAFDPHNTSNLNQGGYGNNQVTAHSAYDARKTQVQMTHHPQNVGQQNTWQQNTTCAPVIGSSSIANDAFKPEFYAVAGNIEGQETQYVNQGQQINQRQSVSAQQVHQHQYVNVQQVNQHQYASQTQQVNPELYANQGQSQFHQAPMQHASLGSPNVSAPQFPNQAYGRYQKPNFISNTNPSLNQNGARVFDPNCSQHFDSNSHVTNLQHMGNKSSYSAGNANTNNGTPYSFGNAKTGHSSPYFAQGASKQLRENLSRADSFVASRQNPQNHLALYSGYSQAAESSINTAPNMGEVPPRMDVSYGRTPYPPYPINPSNQTMQQKPRSAQSNIQLSNHQPYQAADGFSTVNAIGVSQDNMTQSNVQSYAPVDATSRVMPPAYNKAAPSSISSNQQPAQMPYGTNQSLMHQDSRASYQGMNVAKSQVPSNSIQTNRQRTSQWENQGSNVKRRVTDPQTR